MKYKYLFISLLLCFNITVFATVDKSIFTKEELVWIKNNSMVKVAVMNYWNHDGDGNTIHTDYLKILNRYSDLNIVPVRYDSWKEGYADAISKENDVIHGIMNLAWSSEREEKYFLYSQAYIFEPSYLVVRENSDIKSLKDLKYKTILSKEESITDNIIKNISLDIKIQQIKSDDMMYDKLNDDKSIDGFIAYKKDEKLLKEYNFRVVKTIYDKYSSGAIGVKKRYPLLKSIINKIYKSISKDELSNLQNKIYNDTLPYKVHSTLNKKYSFTSQQQKYLKKKTEIKYCADPNWLPYEQIKDGKLKGISLDYKEIFEDKLQVPFTLVPTKSWTESLKFAKEKRCDILSFLVMKTKERNKYLNFTTAYLKAPLILATKIDVTFITDLSALKNKTIGVLKDYAFVDIIKKKYANLNIVEVENIQDGLSQVNDGKIFGYAGTLANVGHLVQTEFIGELKIAGKFDETLNLGVGIRYDDKILFDILETVVLNINESTHKNILNKHIAIKYEKRIDYQYLWKFILICTFILIAFIYWNRRLSSLNKKLVEIQNDLILERNKAQKSTKIKSEFLSNMSHEIRTPLNGIIGMTHLISETTMTNKQEKYLKTIYDSSNALLNIINDILDFSKIESGKFILEKVNFNLKETIDNVFSIVKFKAEEKGLRLDLNYEDIPIHLNGDSFRISQILINLITNAIKFTSSGFVKVKIKYCQDNRYVFSIEDSGIGMNDEQQSRLFQSFSQADGSTTKKYGGTGLGLSISKQLVELMGGKIWCQSKENEGATFTFELSLEKSVYKDEIKKRKKIDIIDLQTLKGSNILLVEDNTINQVIIESLLDTSGINIDIASHGLEALNMCKDNKTKYELILMDIQMPKMDGYEATEQIRMFNKDIPIIALTANAMQEDVAKTKLAGMNEQLNKPIEVEKLYTTLIKYLSKK